MKDKMRVLVVGGSGYVGRLVLPTLAEQYTVRVLDPHPPQPGASVEYVAGSAGDSATLKQAMQGQDALLYMALGPHEPVNGDDWASDDAITGCFDVSVKGVYLALDAARQAGIKHAVYTSSLSVYQAMTWGRGEQRYYVDEELPPDAQPVYGLTKRLGEEVCRNASREWGMSINVLRLCLPLPDDRWQNEQQPTIATTSSDTARALSCALERRLGFQIFHISGDYAEKQMRLHKAKHLLNWEPMARPEKTP